MCAYALFLENKIDRQNQKTKPNEMIEPKSLGLEENQRENHKYDQRNDFLNDFELNQRKRSAMLARADAIGWHLKAIFKKSNAPTHQNKGKKSRIL